MPRKKRQTQLDRAIEQIEGEIAVLQAALERLKQQRDAKNATVAHGKEV